MSLKTQKQELDPRQVLDISQEQEIFRGIREVNESVRGVEPLLTGFEDDTGLGCIVSLIEVSPEQLREYQRIFERYFGAPLKDFYEPVIVDDTVPRVYVEYLNKMHATLFMGIVFNEGLIDLEGLCRTLVRQQGGSLDPPVNLFDRQTFYGKVSPDSRKVEIVRICPHMRERLATIEYMVYIRK